MTGLTLSARSDIPLAGRGTDLVVEPLDETDQAAEDLDDILLAVLPRHALDHVVELLSVQSLRDHVSAALGEQQVQQLGDLGAGVGPVVQGHVGVVGRVEIEAEGDEGEEDAELLIGRASGLEQRGEDGDLLSAVGVLLRSDEAISMGDVRRSISLLTLRPRASWIALRVLKMPSFVRSRALPPLPTVMKSSSA